uniref:Uncharacterized protein n=1 Tax=Craspedostauros australis TaxID=1486917 RepID=A0A7R9WV33_9STRA
MFLQRERRRTTAPLPQPSFHSIVLYHVRCSTIAMLLWLPTRFFLLSCNHGAFSQPCLGWMFPKCIISSWQSVVLRSPASRYNQYDGYDRSLSCSSDTRILCAFCNSP